MTILAQLNDCHCCNDARSFVQKKIEMKNVWVDSKVGFLHALFRFACTSHAVSPRPGLVKLLALSNFPAFVHCDPCFTGLYGQYCLTLCDTLCHRCFLLLDRMRLLSPVSRTQWLLCADPPFFCAPLMTWLRNGSLVSDALFLGGLICFWICLINSFHCFGHDRNCFCCFSRTGIVLFASLLGLGSPPLLSHNFDQPTARSFPFSFYTCIVSRGRMQQLLIDGLNPVICTKKKYVFLISQGCTLRSPGST